MNCQAKKSKKMKNAPKGSKCPKMADFGFFSGKAVFCVICAKKGGFSVSIERDVT
jgi:hypothetical protein